MMLFDSGNEPVLPRRLGGNPRQQKKKTLKGEVTSKGLRLGHHLGIMGSYNLHV